VGLELEFDTERYVDMGVEMVVREREGTENTIAS
jgi:hypothetical protein